LVCTRRVNAGHRSARRGPHLQIIFVRARGGRHVDNRGTYRVVDFYELTLASPGHDQRPRPTPGPIYVNAVPSDSPRLPVYTVEHRFKLKARVIRRQAVVLARDLACPHTQPKMSRKASDDAFPTDSRTTKAQRSRRIYRAPKPRLSRAVTRSPASYPGKPAQGLISAAIARAPCIFPMEGEFDPNVGTARIGAVMMLEAGSAIPHGTRSQNTQRRHRFRPSGSGCTTRRPKASIR